MSCFTNEELGLMGLYDTTNRSTLLTDLHSALQDTYEPDEKQAFTKLIRKLEGMTYAEYNAIRPGLVLSIDHITGTEFV